MDGIKGYSKPTPDGGISVDVEGMLVDAITILKATGHPKEACVADFGKLWDEVKVSIDTSKVRKQ